MNRNPKQVLTEWLVVDARAGSEAAFRDLFQLWHEDLRRMALAQLGQADGVDDVVAEAWVGIARGLHRLDDPACFPRWALSIVDRKSKDWIRRRVRDRRRQQIAADDASLLHPSSAALPGETSEAVDRLRHAVSRLPCDQRELVTLCYELGRSIAEIAEILRIPAGTVKSRLFAARETLRQLFRTTPS